MATSSSTTYLLSRDPKESQRLANQHKYLTHLAGNKLFLPPKFLESSKNNLDVDTEKAEFAVLDAACGGATFLEDVARRYPKAQLYGCDLSPNMFPFYDPSQKETVGFVDTGRHDDKVKAALHLRIQDLTSLDGLPEEWNEKFDIIHLRYVMIWIEVEKFPQVLKNLHRALKPGGWIQFIELYFPKRVYSESAVVRRAARLCAHAFLERPGSSTTKVSIIPHILPAFGFTPSSVHSRSIDSATSSLEPDPAIRELAFHHIIPVCSIPSKKYYAKNEDDTWISGLDDERERYPLDDAEWDELTSAASEGIRTVGIRVPVWFVYAQKAKEG